MTSEAKVRSEITALLQGVGASVFSTSQNRKSRITAGTPDLFCALPKRLGWLAIEAKASGGKSSPEQQALETFCAFHGCPLVVGGFDEVFAYLKAVGLVQ